MKPYIAPSVIANIEEIGSRWTECGRRGIRRHCARCIDVVLAEVERIRTGVVRRSA